MKVVQFNDGTYGLRRFDWFIVKAEYWDFSSKDWIRTMNGVGQSFRTTWEEAENTRLYLEDRGEAV